MNSNLGSPDDCRFRHVAAALSNFSWRGTFASQALWTGDCSTSRNNRVGTIIELEHPRAPIAVREWATRLPEWLEVRTPQTLPTSTRLGRGETEAIALAHELHADVVLIDERDGAKFAREQGLFVTGVLGVLQLAAKRKLVSLSVALQALGKTSFRHTPEQFEQLLKEFAEDGTDLTE